MQKIKNSGRLRTRLKHKLAKNQKILSVYLTLGYPTLEKSIEVMIAVANAGADIIEIGIPFSDPMADGPTIQATSQYALDHGTKPNHVWNAIDALREKSEGSIVIMTYGNIPYQFGMSKFAQLALDKGVEGVIFPDLPPEHFPEELVKLDPIYLIPPNCSKDRSNYIAASCTGFVYVVSQLGITGGKYSSDNRLKEIYRMIDENYPDLPKLQGFGIDSSEAVKNALEAGADGVIVGSEMLRRIGEEGNIENAISFTKELRLALDQH